MDRGASTVQDAKSFWFDTSSMKQVRFKWSTESPPTSKPLDHLSFLRSIRIHLNYNMRAPSNNLGLHKSVLQSDWTMASTSTEIRPSSFLSAPLVSRMDRIRTPQGIQSS